MASRAKYEIHLAEGVVRVYQWCYPNRERAKEAARQFEGEGFEAVVRCLTWTGWVVLTSKPVS